jgi:cation diffusion facilitator CzcD-associated flavoprotein CzcO
VTTSHDVLIIGAGPAGLATSRELPAGLDHLVLERGDCIGHTWANLYDGLVLHTGKHLSALPGMRFPASTPLFPSRLDFLDYLRRYADTFRVPIETNADVASLRRDNGEWIARTTRGRDFRARAVVMATGIVSNPHVPDLPHRDRFRGRIIHSVQYRRPGEYAGQRVLVVGIGNSSGEISAELAGAGADVSVAVRSGARVVPRQILGIPIQYFAVAMNPLPRVARQAVQSAVGRISELVRGAVLPRAVNGPCSNVPLIGLHFPDAVRAGAIRLKTGVAEFTGGGVRFTDGSEEPYDVVILATGYRAAVGPLGDIVRLDGCGFAARRKRVVSADQPGLYFVGHNYDARGGLRNIAQDARLAARLIREAPAARAKGESSSPQRAEWGWGSK